MALLALANIAFAVVAVDAILAHYIDLGFLEGLLRDITYLGGAVGLLHNTAWLVTDYIPSILE